MKAVIGLIRKKLQKIKISKKKSIYDSDLCTQKSSNRSREAPTQTRTRSPKPKNALKIPPHPKNAFGAKQHSRTEQRFCTEQRLCTEQRFRSEQHFRTNPPKKSPFTPPTLFTWNKNGLAQNIIKRSCLKHNKKNRAPTKPCK